MRSAAVILAAALVLSGARVAAEEGKMLAYEAHEATWSQLDLSPDGKTILFDVLGDIYRMPAQGGEATPVLTGDAWERDAVLSPDGKWMAFISDRSGVTNLWVSRPDGSEARQLSTDTSLVLYTSPAWSPDGKSVFVSRAVHRVLAFELWRFALDGAKPALIVAAQPRGNEGWDDRINALGAAVSNDGKAVYYATKLGHTWTEGDPPNWSIARKDLAMGAVETIVPGGMRPVLSPDGTKLAYAARDGARTGLRLRDLVTGADRWLTFPVDRDGQEGGYYYDLLPRYQFTPDGTAILFAKDGTFHRIEIATGAIADVRFSAPVRLALKPNTRVTQKVGSGPVVTHLAEGAVLSPDGRRIAFTALGTLYVEPRKGGKPVALDRGDAFRPAWSADSKTLFIVRWNAAEGGQVVAIPSGGGKATPLTPRGAYWPEVVSARDGKALLALRANQYERMHAIDEIAPAYPTDVVRIPLDGSAPAVIGHGVGLKNLQQTADGRIWVQTPAALNEVADGALRPRVAVVAKPTGQYIVGAAPVDDILLSPDGTRILARTAYQLHLMPMPPAAETLPTLDLMGPVDGHRRITRVGADRAAWDADGKGFDWTVGPDWRHVALTDALAAADPEAGAEGISLAVALPRAMPAGPQLLHGVTALTMDDHGDGAIIDNADILIVADRIAGIGPAGSLPVPADTKVYDLTGKYVIPGLVDVHAHFFNIRRGLQDGTDWEFAVNLAYGVTSSLDPQSFTPDIFAYADRADSGAMVGPRLFSTGPGVFVNANIDSVETAKAVLSRYRDHYGTRNIKSYMVGDRAARQAIADASRALGMMPTTEGAADYLLEMTHAVDGFAGNEHAIPITPLHDDVLRLFAASGISYNPTLGVVYGGGPALFDDIITKRPEDDARLRRFTPPFVIAEKLRNRHWMPAELQTYQLFAADALRVWKAGGLVGAGAHGEMQGLGMQWEMQAFVKGGATPLEALEIATINGAKIIGRQDDLGSLTRGKLADLVVLDADPRRDIANAGKIDMVMRGGLLFDGKTLAPVGRPGSPPPRWWLADTPPSGKVP
ncbi:MAG: PD40 domain-containing protein [Novosphingobium sp.]|nr:PD40 domain-containing protein [Novosphingobium sp.]